MVHKDHLISQTGGELNHAGIDFSVVRAGREDSLDGAVFVCSIQSMPSRWQRLPPPDLMFWDEGHHAAARTWRALMREFPDAAHLGLSATPERLDGKPLGDLFKTLITGPSPAELQALGVLAPCRVFAPTIPDLKGIKVNKNEYDHASAEKAMTDRVLVGDVVEHYRKHADGRAALVFAVSVKASLDIAARFMAAGISAVHIEADTPIEERRAALDGLRDGSVKVISSVEIFTEGLNVPAIGAVILMRPTRSLAMYLQMVGRGRRVTGEYPDLIVLDHAGLFYDHQHPNGERVWSLESAREKVRRAKASERFSRCPECSAVHERAAECPECGHVYDGTERTIAETFGELAEVAGDDIVSGVETQAQFALRIGSLTSEISKFVQMGMPCLWLGAGGTGNKVIVDDAIEWIRKTKGDYFLRKIDGKENEYETKKSFCARMGVSPANLHRMVKRGLPCASGNYVKKEDAENWFAINFRGNNSGARVLGKANRKANIESSAPVGFVRRSEFAKSHGYAPWTAAKWAREGLPYLLIKGEAWVDDAVANDWLSKCSLLNKERFQQHSPEYRNIC